MIKGVFFDAGHTLINVFPKKRFELLRYFSERCSTSDLSNLDWEQGATFAELHYQESHSNPEFIKSKRFWLEHYALSLKAAGLEDLIAGKVALEILENRNQIKRDFWLEDDCINTLSSLKEKGFKLAIVSNWDGSLEEICKDLGIYYYFDFIADSYCVGCEKPDAEIFNIVMNNLQLSPTEVVHVGDLYYTDVVGALKLGITPILYDPNNLLSKKYSCMKANRLIDIVNMF